MFAEGISDVTFASKETEASLVVHSDRKYMYPRLLAGSQTGDCLYPRACTSEYGRLGLAPNLPAS